METAVILTSSPISLTSFLEAMFTPKLRFCSLRRGAKQVLFRATVARYRPFATAQTRGKSTEQLDIDKKKGALAYVPFASDFEMTPLMGTIFSVFPDSQITIRRTQN